MGMILITHCISDTNIDLIRKYPEYVTRGLFPDDEEMHAPASADEKPKSNLFTRIFWRNGQKSESTAAPSEVIIEFTEGEDKEEDYDKSWHGIHYCLTKTDWDGETPLGFIVGGGTELGEDVGYGPARTFRSAEVVTLYEKLKNISTDDLQKNYDPKRMAKLDIYPSIWDREDEDNFDYISDNFDLMKAFFKHCVDHKLGFLIYIC